MLAKTFVVSMMFNRLLEDELYLKNAENANKMSQKLKEGLSQIGVEIVYSNKTNQLFIKLSKKTIDELSTLYAFEVWEDLGESQIIRLVTSWATKEECVNDFIEDIKRMDRSL